VVLAMNATLEGQRPRITSPSGSSVSRSA
jgi:hypothetical protein